MQSYNAYTALHASRPSWRKLRRPNVLAFGAADKAETQMLYVGWCSLQGYEAKLGADDLLTALDLYISSAVAFVSVLQCQLIVFGRDAHLHW